MKKYGAHLLIIVCAIMALFFIATKHENIVLAETIDNGSCGENLTWELDGDVLTISGTGDMDSYGNIGNLAPWHDYRENIKTVKINEGVTSIGDQAFYSFIQLQKIYLPNSLNKVYDSPFYHSSYSFDIYIYSLEMWCNLKYPDGMGWEGDHYLYYNEKILKEFNVPKSITEIGDFAFRDINISKVILHDGITKLGKLAFYNCEYLTSISIPENVSYIGASAFQGCKCLTSVSVPENVSYIGESCFSDCNNLYKINLPDKLKSLENSLFSGCTSLTKINIPSNLEIVSDYTFHWCTSLESIKLPGTVRKIGERAFNHCTSLTEIMVPESVTSINAGTFYECTSLNNVGELKNLVSIGDEAFYNCRTLKKVYFAETLNSIGKYAFYGCENLSDISLPKNLEKLDEYTFYNCNELTSIKIPSKVTFIGENSVPSSIKEVSFEGDAPGIAKAFSGVLTAYTPCGNSTWTDDNKLDYGGTVTWDIWHYYSDYSYNNDATCTKDGTKTAKCDICNKENVIIAEGTKLGHNWKVDYTVDKAATCTEEGVESIHCTVCDAVKADSEKNISATGHNFGAWTIIKTPNCTDRGNEFRICKVCEYKETREIEAKGHSWKVDYTIDKAATCTEEGVESIHCTVCDAVKADSEKNISAIGHNFGAWTMIKTPSCIDKGSEFRICKVCEHKETRELEAKGHSWEVDYTIDKAATCTEDGNKSIHCSACDATKDSSAIKAEGHKYKAWIVTDEATCTLAGKAQRICEVCEHIDIKDIKATGHAFSKKWTIDKEESCTETGSKSHHCINDGCSETSDITEIPATGHDFGAWSTIKSPNCVDKGSEARTCKICEYKETKDVDAKGHEWESVYTTDKESTCIEDGSESIHCKNCDVIKDSRGISAKGHDYETITIKASLKSDGLSYYLCRICQHKDAERTIFKPVGFALSAANYTYNAKTVTPAAVVRDSQGLVLKKGADYNISYASGRKNVGRYAVKVTFKCEYEGTKTMYFTINPKAPTIKTPAAASKSFTAKWSKVSSQATGYQIIYASNSKFTSGKKTVNVGNYKTTSKKITKLKAKSKYYVKVRTYKTVNGTKYYSGWSKVKTVKTK